MRWSWRQHVTIVNGDMFNVNLTSADVVYLYLTTSANEKVRPKLDSDLKKAHVWSLMITRLLVGALRKLRISAKILSLGYPSHTIYLYRKP